MPNYYKKSCETDLDGDLYRTSFKAETPYCFLRKKQFLTEGKSELTMLSFHLKRQKKNHIYIKRKKTCKALFPSTHQFAHSTVKVSRTESLKNLKKPANHSDALTSLKYKEIGHPKVMGWNASINIEEHWCTEGMANARRQCVQCLQASGELNKWKEINIFSHWSRLVMLTVILCMVSSKTESWRYKKGGKQKSLLLEGLRCSQKQHQYWGSWSNSMAPLWAEEGLLFIHPLASQVLDPFGYNQQGRHWTYTLNSQKANSQELWWTSLSNKEVGQTQELQVPANNSNLACRERTETRSPPLPRSTVRTRKELVAVPSGVRRGNRGLSCLFATWLREECKPHRHCTGLGDMAQSHDFTSTPGTAACEHVITEGTVI